ncbi:hypothetical protein LshimejAT787_1802420 [Lyophyllum shimeji]|uniref:Uncharacterized protein n=1 Tax=Lyophyllum shimeji TaxID=47721 RepID=A0A9P3UUM5_LYOSH|nr:hypothetical protein LshimejAT787_1802420 [Lyophyllum shimeji]
MTKWDRIPKGIANPASARNNAVARGRTRLTKLLDGSLQLDTHQLSVLQVLRTNQQPTGPHALPHPFHKPTAPGKITRWRRS